MGARATSFGTVAQDYDRLRPSPPAEAVEWLLPAGCEVAVDLAAGTGLLTRELETRVDHVVAVEPDERMRAVLAARSPQVRALDGVGEAIPLPDASADALFVSSAWHWMDPASAVPEIARVLRDGGRFGLIWTRRDRDVGWVRELDQRRRYEPPADTAARALPTGGPFAGAATASFAFTPPDGPRRSRRTAGHLQRGDHGGRVQAGGGAGGRRGRAGGAVPGGRDGRRADACGVLAGRPAQ